MVTTIKKGSSAETVIDKYKKHTKSLNKTDIRNYCGVLSLKKDPVKLQKEWRDEWK
jgi:hypothetical protein